MSETPNSSAKKNPKSAGSGVMIKGVFFLVILASAGLAWLFLSSSNTTEIAVIRSPENPIRVKPVNEGGRDIPHQNSRVLGMIDDLNQKDEAVETLVLGEKTPEMPPAPVTEQDNQQSIMIATPSEDKPDAGDNATALSQIAEGDAPDNLSSASPQIAGNAASDEAAKADEPVDLMPKQRPVQPTKKIDSRLKFSYLLFRSQLFVHWKKQKKQPHF